MSAHWKTKDIPDQSGRVAIVTGANTGIGFEAARALAEKGAEVILACRNASKAEAAVARLRADVPDAKVRFESLDLSDLDHVRSFSERIHGELDRLDLLINNAGVMVPPESQTAQGFELQIGVNHFGHFALTGQLLDLLAATPGSRVVNVASIAHRNGKINLDDLHFRQRGYSPWAAYGQSKLANLLFTLELQKRLDAAGLDVRVTAAHPGWTQTDLQRHSGIASFLNPLMAMKPAKGALPTLRAATDPAAEGNSYWGPHGMGEMRGFPRPAARTADAKDEAVAARLWEASVEATGVRFDPIA